MELFSQKLSSFLLLDTTEQVLTGDIVQPFAYDEVMCAKVGQGHKPIIHLWRHEKAFVLGLRDRRLPYAVNAMERLREMGYNTAVRNSGGAAVPLDRGVVNISLILPKETAFDFRSDFELMYRLIRETLLSSSEAVQKGEISGSYCPGDYDLSIAGRKFCGIAQRRQTKAFVVQAFVVVEGAGEERARVAREFYNTAAVGETSSQHPLVTPNRMGSLQELADVPSVEAFVASIHNIAAGLGNAEAAQQYPESMKEQMERMAAQIRERYDK